MDSGSYAVCAGLLARSQQLDLAAQDIANVNTAGYRGQRSSFQAVLAGVNVSQPSWSETLNNFGVLAESRVMRNSGNLQATGNPLDFGIEGDGYFAVQAPAGSWYTRSGQFTRSAQGMLVTQEGYPVLGEQGPVRLPEGAVSLSADGTISVGGAVAGKLKLVQFSNDVPLRDEGASYLSAGNATVLRASSANLRQGMLESSNVDAVGSAVSLIAIQRQAQMLQRALTAFHSDLDRIAAQEIAKVG